MIDLVAWVFWLALAVVVVALIVRRTKTQCVECTSWIPRDARRCPKCTAEQ